MGEGKSREGFVLEQSGCTSAFGAEPILTFPFPFVREPVSCFECLGFSHLK